MSDYADSFCIFGNIKPLFSVVIPLYNKRDAVETMIKSVLNQDFDNYEVVIVDDGSTDGSLEAIMPLLNARCRVIKQTNQGVSVARNRGIAEARGEYIALIDADDYWYSNHLSTAAAFFAEHTAIKWFSGSWLRQDDTAVQPAQVKCERSFEVHNYFDVGHTESKHPVWRSVVVFKRSSFEGQELFPPNVKRGQDLYAWYKMATLEPSYGWTAYPTAIYGREQGVRVTTHKLTVAFVERILEDLSERSPLHNQCLKFHVQNCLASYLELGDAAGIRLFLRHYKGAMGWAFRVAWWALSFVLTLCGRRFTSTLLEVGLKLWRPVSGR